MRGLNKFLIVVQVYAISNIAINLGFHILIILNSSFPHFLSFCNLYLWVNNLCLCVRLVYIS